METLTLPRALYTVSEVCRVLRPGMTPRKVHHWLHTGLLGAPVRPEYRGRPTLLSFDQLIKVRTVQRLRDDLGFTLREVREGIEWLLNRLVQDEWGNLYFFRTGAGDVGVRDEDGSTFAIGGQGVMDTVLPELQRVLEQSRSAWEAGRIEVEGYSMIVSDVAVMAGSPVVRGTRVETAFIAHLAPVLDLPQLRATFPRLPESGLIQAIEFEGVTVAA